MRRAWRVPGRNALRANATSLTSAEAQCVPELCDGTARRSGTHDLIQHPDKQTAPLVEAPSLSHVNPGYQACTFTAGQVTQRERLF